MGISLEDMEDASKYYEEQGDAQVLTCSPSRRERPGTRACLCCLVYACFLRHVM